MTTPEHDESLLAPSFDALRAASHGLDTPPEVEQALLSTFARQFPKKRWYQRLGRQQWGVASGILAGAGTLAILAVTLVAPMPERSGQPAFLDEGGDFIALESRERIEMEAAPQLVEAVLPRTALAGMAGALDPQTAGESVRAQLLIGADGEPLALRLLPL
ncbi:hypothetical protein [Pseudoduganella sp. OTU4001]|uniref:hypothetical protein n=1 Tax=Pseudoduganella sp. OTU4001 TaxID=3043854 RepID=UPI00313A7696